MLTIHAFTDPVCVWCWAAEAPLRGLETHFGSRVQMRHVAGGMVKDILDFEDSSAGLTGQQSMAEINANIAAHYHDTALTHHMPIMTVGFRLFSDENPSSWPQNIAFKAAQIASPDRANRFLRRIRQATVVESQPTGDPAVLFSLAGECGIDRAAYAAALTDGRALAAFHEDLKLGVEQGIDLFPTFILSYEENNTILSGYVTFPEFAQAIEKVTMGKVRPTPSPPDDERLLALLDQYLYLSEEEIRQAFDLPEGLSAKAWCQRLEKEGRLKVTPHWVERLSPAAP